MIFPNVIVEEKLQVNDKTRLDATKTYISKDEAAITLVEIDPGDGSYIDVTGSIYRDWYLDWEYSTAGSKTVNVRVTTDGVPVISSNTLTIISVVDDNLFSNDAQLTSIEEEILKYVKPGRNSFLNVHRKAQEIIMSEIDSRGVLNSDGTKILISQIVELEDFSKWSGYIVLGLVYNDLSNSVDDKFADKARSYRRKEEFYRDKSFIRIDFDKDGISEVGETMAFSSVGMLRV